MATRSVVFLVFPGFQLLDLTGPLAAFQMAGMVSDRPAYRLSVVSRQGGMIASTVGIELATFRPGRIPVDTLIVVGGAGARDAATAAASVPTIRALSRRARRTASVCTGTFLLAAAGLLRGRRVTTHWRHAGALQRQHPDVHVDGDRIFLRDGAVWSSAGITAGIDLALALIEDDLGPEIARATARELVVYHRRSGGQSQFSSRADLEPTSDRLRRVLSHVREHLREPLPVTRLAAIAGVSPRQFARTFRAETGESPARAVERLRAEAARLRVESSSEPIEAVAAATGFTDPERMRRAFIRRFGHPPQALRRAARGGGASRPVGAAHRDRRSG